MTQAITIVVGSHLATLLEHYAKACKSGSDAIARGDYESAAGHIDRRNDKANSIALWLEILIDEQARELQEAA
ncbi:hypothetical protein D3C78_505950 [compost metagenome]